MSKIDFISFIVIPIVVASGVVGLCLFAEIDMEGWSCDQFQNFETRNIPARCISYFTK